MAKENQETESKFWVSDLLKIEKMLTDLGAKVVELRAFESNIRFDTPDNTFTMAKKVLRLRKYNDNRLTFKGPGKKLGGALSRLEIETVVTDHENMRLILHEIGFEERAVYEKYRKMVEYKDCLVTLDELPYGNFIEIEGTDFEQISKVALDLNIDPMRAIPLSYQNIFELMRDKLKLKAANLTFDEVELSGIDLAILGFEKADYF